MKKGDYCDSCLQEIDIIIIHMKYGQEWNHFYNINKIIADNYFFLSNCMIKFYINLTVFINEIIFRYFRKIYPHKFSSKLEFSNLMNFFYKTMHEKFVYIKIKIYIKYRGKFCLVLNTIDFIIKSKNK